jgi:hypothetical protein
MTMDKAIKNSEKNFLVKLMFFKISSEKNMDKKANK